MARYERVLVPLDGSATAELALSDAVALAEATGAEVTLLQVIEPVTEVMQVDGPPITVDEQLDMRKARAFEYLDRARHRIGGRRATIRVAVEVGRPADTILEVAMAKRIDLIVMATHGRTGVRRWVLGSVAEKVVRAAHVAVLLVRASA